MASNEVTRHAYEARELDKARPRQPSDGDVEHYIDLYRLSLEGQSLPTSYTPGLSTSHSGNSPVSQNDLAGLRQLSSEAAGEDGFLSSSNVAQELRNLANLRRLSLDVSNNHNVDPDVPLQSFDLAPGQGSPGNDEDTLGDSLYWVPAGIHPEIAPQEWQSFVQRRDSQFDLLDNSSPFRSPSLKRGLSRSGSLLSRQVTEQHAEEYRDAAPDLARRRSKAHSPVAVQGFARLGETSLQRANSGDFNDPTTPTSTTSEDAPILVPPPGQILRRAARTGKGRGSYRKPGKSTITRAEAEEPSDPVVSPGALDPEPYLLQQSTESSPSREQQDVQRDPTEVTKRVHRKKSDHRQTQILGPPSPLYDEAMQLGASAASLYLEQRDTQGHQSDEPGRRRPTTADEFRTRPSTADEFHVSPPLARDQTSHSVRPASEIVGDDRRSAEQEARQPLATTSQPVSAGSAESLPACIIPGVPSSTPPHTEPGKQEGARPGVKRELSAASLTRAVMSGAAVSSTISSGPVNAAVLGPSARSAIQQQGPSPEKPRQGSVEDVGAKKSSGWGKLFGTEDRSKSKHLRPATGVVQAGVLGAGAASGTRQLKRVTSATEETGKESTNLFSSIFGGKKKEKEVNLQVDTAYGGGKVMTVPARPPQPQGTVRPPLHEPHFYSRFPIQLERAIYRMAHLKLGNSRRPLLHQVLLSNFMYGYLALVGAGQQRESSQPPQHQQQQQLQPSQAPVVPSSPGTPPQPIGPQSKGEQPRGRASQLVNQREPSSSRHVEHAPVSSGAFTETPKTGKRQSPPQQTYAEGMSKAAPVSVPAIQAPTRPGRPGPPKRESSMNIYRPGAS